MLFRSRVASMFVILPQANNLGLPTVEMWTAAERQLQHDKIEELISQMKLRDVEVYLPRFTMDCRLELAETLRQMGLKQAFDALKADFSGMIRPHSGEPFFIGRIDHKARIEVDERGTKAAAATAVDMTFGEVEVRPEMFAADRPFVFFIRHKVTGAILIAGRVMNPKQ